MTSFMDSIPSYLCAIASACCWLAVPFQQLMHILPNQYLRLLFLPSAVYIADGDCGYFRSVSVKFRNHGSKMIDLQL